MIRYTLLCLIFPVLLTFSSCLQPKRSNLVFSVGGAPAELLFWQRLTGQFSEESGIEVELLRQPADTDQQRQGLMVALRAQRNDPDLFLMDVAWISLFAESGWLANLDRVVDRSVLFKSVTDSLDLHDGHLTAIPIYMDTGLLFYRKDLLERYHLPVPATYDELRKSSLYVQSRMRKENPNFYGFVWQGMQYEGLVVNFLEFAGRRGGFLDNQHRIHLNRKENRRALEMMREFIHKDQISPPDTFTRMKEEEVRLAFQQGNALFERNWPYAYKLHNEADSPVRGRVGVALLPGPTAESRSPALGGWHVGVSRYSDRKTEAFRFVRFLASKKAQMRMRREMGWNPGRRDLYGNKNGTQDDFPFYATLERSFELARPRPAVPYYVELSSILQTHLSGVMAGRLDPATALDSSQWEMEKLLERYNLKREEH